MNLKEIIKKKGKEKISMLTAYDYQMAKILDEAGVDLILVGDSLAMVFQGMPDTKKVTMKEMLYHTKAVARGAKNAPVIGDMPIHSYDTPESAVKNARKFLKAGARGVKLEGNCPAVVKALKKQGIEVMGHLGLLPQTAREYRVRGKSPKEAEKILEDARSLDALGVFAIVLECVPEKLAKKITASVKAPTVGIGAGRHCDGQVLVINDLLGMDTEFKAKHIKRYLNLNRLIKRAVKKFIEETKKGVFPAKTQTFH